MLGIALAVGIALVGAFALAAWLDRGESQPDRPGERTCAIFRARVRDAGDEQPGRELLVAIAAQLRLAGVESNEPSYGDGGGWAIAATTPRGYVELVATDGARDTWALTVRDPSSGPGPIALAQAIDRALRAIPEVSGVRWQRREAVDWSDPDAGAPHPRDE